MTAEPSSGGWVRPDVPEPRQPGPVELAVEEDLRGVPVGVGKVFMRESARKIARAIDARGDDEPPSSLAKAVDTLFKVMTALRARDEGGGQSDLDDLSKILGSADAGSPAVSPPLRYPPKPRPADRGTGNRKGRVRARPE